MWLQIPKTSKEKKPEGYETFIVSEVSTITPNPQGAIMFEIFQQDDGLVQRLRELKAYYKQKDAKRSERKAKNNRFSA